MSTSKKSGKGSVKKVIKRIPKKKAAPVPKQKKAAVKKVSGLEWKSTYPGEEYALYKCGVIYHFHGKFSYKIGRHTIREYPVKSVAEAKRKINAHCNGMGTFKGLKKNS